jgi:hypothetical protein
MKLSRFAHHATFGLLILVGFAGATASAAGTSTASKSTDAKTPTVTVQKASSVQGYASDAALQDGTIVQLDSKTANKVLAASSKNLQQMYGVVVDPHQLALTFSDASLQNEAYVATSGTYNVLVSTQAGVIKPGDYITLSAVDGVAMNAADASTTVFGRAAGGFDGKSKSLGGLTLKDSSGATKQVQLGMVPVAINIQRNPNIKSTKANVPPWLQAIGQAVAQKPVGAFRIYLSMAITTLCIIIGLVTLYAGIRNAMIAIGRNPLSKKSIFRGLLEIILTSFLILIIGLFAVYLLLKL